MVKSNISIILGLYKEEVISEEETIQLIAGLYNKYSYYYPYYPYTVTCNDDNKKYTTTCSNIVNNDRE